MKIKNHFLLFGPIFCVFTGLTFSCTQTSLEEKNETPVQKFNMTTDIPPSITTPDVIETSLGTMRFFDGFPDEATVQKVYDNLDLQRGVQVFLTCIPPASAYAFRTGIRSFGPDNQTVLIS